ncbi:MAG: YidC/Oxa1 family membrane protein insertase [Candidatus Spechtbacterales bacterium]
MNFIITIFNETIFKPILNFLLVIVDFIPGNDLWIGIILVTIIIRLFLYPLSYKALKSQRELTKLQPEIKKIQKENKDDKQKQSMAVMALYKEKGINPFAGCLPFIIQIPVIIGMYRVFLVELRGGDALQGLIYPFVTVSDNINASFFNIGVITEIGPLSLVFGILAGFAQFVLSKLTLAQKDKTGLPVRTKSKKSGAPDFQNMMGKQMTYVLPFVTIFIAQSFPAGLALYWFVTTLFSIGQQYVINKSVG